MHDCAPKFGISSEQRVDSSRKILRLLRSVLLDNLRGDITQAVSEAPDAEPWSRRPTTARQQQEVHQEMIPLPTLLFACGRVASTHGEDVFERLCAVQRQQEPDSAPRYSLRRFGVVEACACVPRDGRSSSSSPQEIIDGCGRSRSFVENVRHILISDFGQSARKKLSLHAALSRGLPVKMFVRNLQHLHALLQLFDLESVYACTDFGRSHPLTRQWILLAQIARSAAAAANIRVLRAVQIARLRSRLLLAALRQEAQLRRDFVFVDRAIHASSDIVCNPFVCRLFRTIAALKMNRARRDLWRSLCPPNLSSTACSGSVRMAVRTLSLAVVVEGGSSSSSPGFPLDGLVNDGAFVDEMAVPDIDPTVWSACRTAALVLLDGQSFSPRVVASFLARLSRSDNVLFALEVLMPTENDCCALIAERLRTSLRRPTPDLAFRSLSRNDICRLEDILCPGSSPYFRLLGRAVEMVAGGRPPAASSLFRLLVQRMLRGYPADVLASPMPSLPILAGVLREKNALSAGRRAATGSDEHGDVDVAIIHAVLLTYRQLLKGVLLFDAVAVWHPPGYLLLRSLAQLPSFVPAVAERALALVSLTAALRRGLWGTHLGQLAQGHLEGLCSVVPSPRLRSSVVSLWRCCRTKYDSGRCALILADLRAVCPCDELDAFVEFAARHFQTMDSDQDRHRVDNAVACAFELLELLAPLQAVTFHAELLATAAGDAMVIE